VDGGLVATGCCHIHAVQVLKNQHLGVSPKRWPTAERRFCEAKMNCFLTFSAQRIEEKEKEVERIECLVGRW
jgi:hypothetical protein